MTDNATTTETHTKNRETDNLVKTDHNGTLHGFKIPNFQYTVLGMLLLYRLTHNRDCKVLITSSGSTTGTGKTTLAIQLCRWIRSASNDLFGHSRKWDSEEHAFVDLHEYLGAYKSGWNGDALLLDEIEKSADSRRSMSKENQHLSMAWAILRYRNIVSVATLPSVSMLDFRLLELADVWINVQRRGVANSYYLTVNDFDGDIIRKRMERNGYKEQICWPDLDDDDPAVEYLEAQKADMGVPGIDDGPTVYDESDVKEQERKVRRSVAVELLKLKESGTHDLTQSDMGDIVGFDQSTVSKIKREAL